MHTLKRYWIVALLFVAPVAEQNLHAQDFSGDFMTADSTPADSGEMMIDDAANAEKAFPTRFDKHSRFIVPYDSLRELIFYSNVVEDPDCNECTADSLYWRFMRYLEGRFGKKELKELIKEAKPGNKIVVILTVPLVTEPGNNVKVPDGKHQYELVMRFQDNRYKYEFSKFVHIRPVNGAAGGESRTYAEYYRTAKTNTRNNDLCLMGMDAEVKRTVAGLTKALREKWKPEDEDDW